ncbi:hypothetical protein BTUL_0086g00390 [Botrytis tulipae]|uniref:Protein kinase domain-containing protein n=1 Tax=Botrytis tulipae TaxID=87230 RepID=A0A4Z1EJ98_9HELO|nr:hypothetical protein BTUL_0086g00390 [Botrytis tulipae]
MSSQAASQPFAIGGVLRGHSGRSYQIKEVLSKRLTPLLCVYPASAEGETQSGAEEESYVIKNSLKGDFEYYQELQKPLVSCPNLRTIIDTIPDFELFVYPFLKDNLLQFCQRDLSVEIRKGILKSALTGLAEMHDRHIIHGDIKPNNILLDYEETADKRLHVKSVRVSDLEDSIILSPGKGIVGGKLGNQFWRSPESWCKAKQSVSSDIFSMGIVAIYIMDKQMIFYDGLKSEDFVDGEAWNQIIMRHISFFWDQDDYLALLDHIGEDNPFFDRVIDMVNDFKGPMTPVRKWSYLDENFRDLVVNMARLDPASRLSAREALEHPFFSNVSS